MFELMALAMYDMNQLNTDGLAMKLIYFQLLPVLNSNCMSNCQNIRECVSS